MSDYYDLLIIDRDTTDIMGVEQSTSGRASIAQDIKHMIIERGFLTGIIAERDVSAIAIVLTRIETAVEDDTRIQPGTASVEQVGAGKIQVSATTVDYGHVSVTV